MRRMTVACLILLACVTSVQAQDRPPKDKSQWANVDPARRQWFRDQKLTPETMRRLHTSVASCCDAGDVFPTRFRVVEDGSKYGTETYEYLTAEGKWKAVHPDIVQRKPTPDGQPVLFIYAGREVCLIVDAGGT